MNCMKCGREIPEGQVFCEDCLAEMEKYPIKPGTIVQIPVQPPVTEIRKPRYPRKRTPEERIRRLHLALRVLLGVTAGLLIALVITIHLLAQAMRQQHTLPVGQNYSTSQATEGTGN